MIQSIIDIVREISLRHKAVRTFRYQDKTLNNAQNNFKGYQVYVSDYNYHQLNITTNIFTSEFQIYILNQPTKESESILETQDMAFTIAVDILAFIDNHFTYMSVYDYSIIAVSHYTDDDSAGVKLSVVLQVPSPLNICDYENNFNDEPYEDEPDHEIDVDTKDIGEITINKIKLPKTNDC